jgi:hypothetical protein
MAGDTFVVLNTAVSGKMKDASTGTITRIKTEVNNAIKEICGKRDWTFMYDLDNIKACTGARRYTISDSDYGQITSLKYSKYVTSGNAATVWTITQTGITTTYRYTYTGTGLDPNVGIGHQEIGDSVTFAGFTNAANNATFTITGVGTNYVEVTNADPGVAESTKTDITFQAATASSGTRIPKKPGRLSTTDQAPATVTAPRWYSVPSSNTIELETTLPSDYVLFYDYKKNISTLSGDSDECAIPSGWSHAVIQLAYANMLEVDDDSRAVNAYNKATIYLKDMIREFVYTPDLEVTMTREPSLDKRCE